MQIALHSMNEDMIAVSYCIYLCRSKTSLTSTRDVAPKLLLWNVLEFDILKAVTPLSESIQTDGIVDWEKEQL